MEELLILLTPNKELKKVFPNVPIIGFRNAKGTSKIQSGPLTCDSKKLSGY